MDNKKIKQSKGITLIALIITIVVLLILAVVAIGAVQDSNIIGYAQNAATGYNTAKGNEENTLVNYIDLIDNYINENGDEDEIQYYYSDNFNFAGTDGPGVVTIKDLEDNVKECKVYCKYGDNYVFMEETGKFKCETATKDVVIAPGLEGELPDEDDKKLLIKEGTTICGLENNKIWIYEEILYYVEPHKGILGKFESTTLNDKIKDIIENAIDSSTLE